ncbi:MAG: hypothetical protein KA175_03965 [Flavobacteriales bacterium]|nr:hypothetical protein [Flavobacteriales bacterium]
MSTFRIPSRSAFLLVCTITIGTRAHGQAATLDATFTVGAGATDRVMAIAQQPDGKSVITGYFTSYRGAALNRIARVNLDGTVDGGFGIGTGFNSFVLGVALRSDGDIVAAGNFNQYNGTSRVRVARLNSDGTLDGGFTTGTGCNAVVNAVAITETTKTFVGGAFTTYGGTARSRIARINDDGTLDTGFDPGTGFNGDVYCLAVQSDGKVLVGGVFSSYNGTGRNGIARLNADGTLDTGFDTGSGTDSWVATITIQPDGKLIIGGNFTTVNGTGRNRIARLNSDGTLDTGFTPGTGCNSWVYCSDVQADGKVLIGGDFTSVAGSARNRLARLNSNGSLDVGFAPVSGANNWVYSMNVQPEGRVLIGGGFTTYNGVARARLARVNLDCDQAIELEITTDGNGAQTSWEIVPIGFTYAVLSGSGYPSNATSFASGCLSAGCYRLLVLDSGSNGITGGGYVLRGPGGERLIDNAGNGANFSSESALLNQQGFCLPMGGIKLTFANCDKEDLLIGNAIECGEDPDVTAEWGVGDQTNDGYQFWFVNPNGVYSRRILRNHASSGGFGPPSATRACRLDLGSMVTNPLPLDVLLNVRIRPLVNGTYGEFGPACRVKVLSAPPPCPVTQLIDAPLNPNFSCGVTKTFGGSDKVHAYPVTGANKYRFRFEQDGGGFIRQIANNTPSLVLNWVALPLVDGVTYNVTVQESFDGGANYCAYGPSCQVIIDNTPAAAPRALEAQEGTSTSLRLWPVPVNDGVLWVDLPEAADMTAELAVLDLTGRVLYGTQVQVNDGTPVQLTLPVSQAPGTYVLRASSNGTVWSARFVQR